MAVDVLQVQDSNGDPIKQWAGGVARLRLGGNLTGEMSGTALLIDSVLPSGVIIMFNGSTDDIPAGWLLCDGTNGTPDLSSLFILRV